MTDTAQPTTGLAHRLVGDPNSTIGAMIKRGLTGAVSSAPVAPKPSSSDSLDTLAKILAEVEQTSASPTVTQPIEQPTNQPVAQSTALLGDLTGEGVMSQVMSQVVSQATDTLNPAGPVATTTRKESAAEAVSLEQIAADAARGAQQVEVEPIPEISPEVESYLQKVEDNKEMAPAEVVIADGSQTTPVGHQYPSQPVVVLPITEEEEAAGAKKSPKFSIRWLVEWSRRLMKVFVGKVVYRSAEGSAS